MTKIIGLCVLLFISVNTFSQSNSIQKGYTVVGLSDNSKMEYYVSIINKIDFEQYRLRSEVVSIKFRNGFVVELLSAESFSSHNTSVVPGNYVVKHADDFQLPEFKILDDGTLLTLQRAKKTKSEIKYNSIK